MTPIRVLIADDDANFAESLAATLASDDRLEVVASARDGEEAVARCAETHPDVVAMDIHMPAMDGVEATKQIRARGEAPPVILISGSMFTDARDLAEEAGAVGYLTKAQCERELVPAILDAAQGAGGSSA